MPCIRRPRRTRPACRVLESEAKVLKSGILNPLILSLLARVRHTNLLISADRGFPSWPQIETVDLSLVDDIPTVVDVLNAVRGQFVIGQAWMAEEFLRHNEEATRQQFRDSLAGVPISHESHVDLKRRVPSAIGLIRTGDSRLYTNVILESG
jgi:D-ribose pyranase